MIVEHFFNIGALFEPDYLSADSSVQKIKNSRKRGLS